MNDEYNNEYNPEQYKFTLGPDSNDNDTKAQTEEADVVAEAAAENTGETTQETAEPTTQEETTQEETIQEETVQGQSYEEPRSTAQSYQGYYETGSTYRYEPSNENKPKRQKGAGSKVLLCICLAIVFGVVTCSAYRVTDYAWSSIFGGKPSVEKGQTVDATTTVSGDTSTIASDVADIAEEVMPAVVSIQNLSVQQVQDWFFGTQQYEQTSSGSGIIIGQNDSELLVVTNNHVVADSTTLTVTFKDGNSVDAKIKGADSKYDVAIIAVPISDLKDETKNSIKTATLGDSSALRVGEPTIAIGNALGYGQSVTCGIVSALEREIDDYDAKFIQTDAAINPGNSGGALLNAKGEVIGINTAKISDSSVEGIGYAIPISDIKDMLDTLMNRQTRNKVEEAKRGYLGITGTSVDSSLAEVYHIPEGVFISEVVKGGAADEAGLSKGTVITKLDGSSVETIEALKAELEYYAIGEKVTLTVLIPQTNGEYEETDVEVVLQKSSN